MIGRCHGCNCHSPTRGFDVNQFGDAKHPGCNNDIGDEGTSFGVARPLPCGFVMISGESCDHPWWKHTSKTKGGTLLLPMVTPNLNGAGEPMTAGPFPADGEPAAMYVATFLGKECVHGTCVFVQKEGVVHTNGGCDGRTNPYTRCCSVKAYDEDTGGEAPTRRDPWTRDASGNVVAAPMLFDLRNNNQLQLLFANSGGEGTSLPSCCWCRPTSEGTAGSCELNWDGWVLHPTGDDGEGNPLARSSPRITYQENNTAFWNAVGRPEPWYSIDSTYGDGTLQMGSFETTQFALQNWEYWPSLPRRVCVVPVRWPYHNTPCDTLTNALESCAPAENIPAGGSVSDYGQTGCITGLSVSMDVQCVDSDAVITVTVRSAGCGIAGVQPTPEYRNATLPSGVTEPSAPCDYWWLETGLGDCTYGAMVYWDGSDWIAKVFKTEDGTNWTTGATATKSNEECTCAGVSFDATYTDANSPCCGLTPCGDCTESPAETSLTLEITSDCPSIDGIVMTVPWDGAQFADIQTINGVQVDAQISADGCSFSIQLDDGCLEGFSASFGDIYCAPAFEASKTMNVVGCSGSWGCTGASQVTFTVTQ